MFDRYAIHLETGSVEHKNFYPRPQEFPRINERFTCLHNRCVYTLSTMDLARTFALNPEQLRERNLDNNLMSYDLQTGKNQTHYFKGCSLSVPVFVEA